MEKEVNRKTDDRIPKHWRDGFERFTGMQPTYEEYQRNPDMWPDDFDETLQRRIGVAFLIMVAIAVVAGFF